jgi:urocanate hydratase
VQFQGLPARVCLVHPPLRVKFGLALNDLVAQGAIKAPLVIGCDGPGEGTAPSPAVPTATLPLTIEGLLAGLSARRTIASWVAIEDGGRAGAIGSGLPMFAIVADGTEEMAHRIERVLGSD